MKESPIDAKIQIEIEKASRKKEIKRQRWVEAIEAVKNEIAGTVLGMDEIKGMLAQRLGITKEQFQSGMIYLLNYTSFAKLLKYHGIQFKEGSKKETENTFTIENIEQWFTNFFKDKNRKPKKAEIDEAIKKGGLPARESVSEIEKGESLMKIQKRILAKWELGNL